jgi:hypothetical protein
LDLLAAWLQSLLITLKYSVVVDLHSLQFTVAHALGFPVSTSRLPAKDTNIETITSNHYEVFLSSISLHSVQICTQYSQVALHSHPCTRNCSTLLDPPLTEVKVKVTLRLTVSQSMCLCGSCTHIYYCLKITVVLLWGALHDERTSLSFVPLPAQSFSGPSPLGLATIFYCFRFEISLFVASYNSQGHID